MAVIGSGIIKSKRTKFGYEPSSIGKLRASAGFHLYRQGLVKKVIFTGGENLGANHPSVARMMAEYANIKYKLPKEVISLDEKAMDTVAAIEKLIVLKRVYHWKKIGILSSDFHLKRIKLAAKLLKLPIVLFSAEKILLKIPVEEKRATRFLSSKTQPWEVKREEKIIKMLPDRLKSRRPNRILNEKGELKEFLDF